MLENVCRHPSPELVERLREAESGLEKAREKQCEVQKEIVEAEAKVAKVIEEIENPQVFMVEALYDGVKKAFEVRIEETVKHLLDKVIRAFGAGPNPHTLSLYKDGKELADGQTIKNAGIKPCDVLLLRPSKVKGGV